MKNREKSRIEMFRRKIKYAADRKNSFPPEKLSGKTVAELDGVIKGMEAAEKGQILGTGDQKTATVNATTLYDSVSRDVQKIIRTATDGIALDEPGFEQQFPAPVNEKAETLVATAKAFLDQLDDADTLKKFTDHELKQEVIDRLEVNSTDLAGISGAQDTGTEGHVTATQAMSRFMQQGMKCSLRLDVMVENIFENSPDDLAAWQLARHIERAPVKKKAAKPTGEVKPV